MSLGFHLILYKSTYSANLKYSHVYFLKKKENSTFYKLVGMFKKQSLIFIMLKNQKTESKH